LQKILRMRLGWEVQGKRMLQALGKDTELSGGDEPVSRQRIHQLEVKGKLLLRKFIKDHTQPPALLRAVELLNERTPIPEKEVVSIVRAELLTKIDFNYDVLKKWAEVCGVEWLLADAGYNGTGGRIFVSVRDEEVRKRFESLLPEIGRLCRGRTFQRVEEISSILLAVDEDLIRTLINLSQDYAWLDNEKAYFWKLPTSFWGQGNRAVSACRRLFSVISRCPLNLVSEAVNRVIKHGKATLKEAEPNFPPEEVLAEMLRQTRLFEVHDGHVKRVQGVEFNELNPTDVNIIRALRGMGSIVNFSELCDNIVREGSTTLWARLMVNAYSPFVVPVSRGQYRVLPNVDDIDVDQLSPVVRFAQSEGNDDDVVSEVADAEILFEVDARTLLTGKCKLTGGVVSDSDWEVIGGAGEKLGVCKIKCNQISQIKVVLAKLTAEKGDIVQIFLNEEGGKAVFKLMSDNG